MTDYGNLKPDDDLTDVFTKVVKDVSDTDYGAVKAGSNTALLLTLYLLEDEDPDAVQYHVQREGYDSLNDMAEAVLDRQQRPFVLSIANVLDSGRGGPEEAVLSLDLHDHLDDVDDDFSADLQDGDDGGGD
jgi:hypothetical protein